MRKRNDTNDAGRLILRLVAAAYLTERHASPKVFGDEAHHGPIFEKLGFRPGAQFATAAGASELTSAILIALGALGPVGPAILLSTMIVAVGSLSASEGKFEFGKHEIAMLYAAVAAWLTIEGPGRLSVDSLVGIDRLDTPWVRGLALVGAVGGALFTLSMRQTEPPVEPQED